MPLGVEHPEPYGPSPVMRSVILALMPLGVEHPRTSESKPMVSNA